MAEFILKQSIGMKRKEENLKSHRFSAGCAKCLPDSVLVHVERQTLVQDVLKQRLFYESRIL